MGTVLVFSLQAAIYRANNIVEILNEMTPANSSALPEHLIKSGNWDTSDSMIAILSYKLSLLFVNFLQQYRSGSCEMNNV